MSLPTPDRFAEFYQAVHDFPPFPWQKRMAARACAGNWPRVIALPTAAGKTACIDIAVFALACGAKNAPRRIFFVVDRRIVVDQAFRHAKDLAKKLEEAKTGILKDVADALRGIAQDNRPLDVYALRGGMYRDTAWTRSPLQPTVIASTVDQVGSRLLFRGYGVSDSMKPIHAGLVGNDALILLDEAHCSKPFDQTMLAIEKYRQWNPAAAPFRFVSLTATPAADIPEEQIERDQKDDRDPTTELGKRMAAVKTTTLVVAEKAKGKKGTNELVKVLQGQAEKLVTPEGCVGIIVNRVQTARDLKKELGDDAVLLTGRMCPLDRDRLFENKLKPLLSNADGTPPKFVIGTQCLEVGADFDFHALVTECASLDALRQRFGRLNRVARRNEAQAVIVIRGDQIADTSDDPVYGASLANTWKFLQSKAVNNVLDFGVAAVRRAAEGVDLTPLNAPTTDAPVLFPAHLDCWVQTHPIPTPDPDPALFLHGPKAGPPDVSVVFRDDLGGDDNQWCEIVALCPPSSSEAISVPIAVFKRWLADKVTAAPTSESDLEGESQTGEEPEATANRRALLWCGPDKNRSPVISQPAEVRPDGVYVIPCSAPDVKQLGDFVTQKETDPPADYAEEAFQHSRDKALLRLQDFTVDKNDEEYDAKLTAAIAARKTADSPPWECRAVEHLVKSNNRIDNQHPCGGIVVTSRRRLFQFDPEFLDDAVSSWTAATRPITLVDHAQGVANVAHCFAQACKLESATFQLAGLYHDLGKLDTRFQRKLKGYAGGSPLAKSGSFTQRDGELVHKYPKGARHELLSAAILAGHTSDDLLLHLIATHHGSARPFADPVEENDAVKPIKVSLLGLTIDCPSSKQNIAAWNAELPERFWRMIRKFGWWGAAYREAIFRLADHTQSRIEQEDEWKPVESNSLQIPHLPPVVETGRFHALPLSGLDGANPLAFLAALGTFRLADELFPGVTLRWERTGVWHPVLGFPNQMAIDDFVQHLYKRVHRSVVPNTVQITQDRHKEFRRAKKAKEQALQSIKEQKLRGADRAKAIAVEVAPLEKKERDARHEWLCARESSVPAPYLSLGKSLSVTTDEFFIFASRAAEQLQQSGPKGRYDADFIPAFGCESRSGKVISTEFELIKGSGNQFFLDTFANLMLGVTIEQLNRALIGPWTYDDRRLTFRWDPIEDRRYAFSWADPSDGDGVPSEQAANLLAAFALPLFPVIPTQQSARTTGFDLSGETPSFTWPLWSNPFGLDVVRSLFQLADLHQVGRNNGALRLFGVNAAFQVRKFEVGKPPLSKLNLCPAIAVQ